MSIAEKSVIIAENEQRVYDAGYAAGQAAAGGGDTEASYNEGYTDGQQAEYDRFWDILQNNGMPILQYFRLPTWNDENFKPQYTVYAEPGTWSNGLDSGTKNIHCSITDIRPETLGVNVDWSLCENFNGALIMTPIRYVGVVNMTNAQSGGTLFYNAKSLESVEKVILPNPAKKIAFNALGFNTCRNLTEIRFEGEFYGSVSFAGCSMLSLESAKSALLHLPNYTGTENEQKFTITFHAKTWALLDGDNTAPDGVTWRTYVDNMGWLL